MPSISVIIPCYNCARFLTETLASVRAQSGEFELLEAIIVDDASSDPATKDLLEKLRNDPLIRILPNAYPKGAAGARNTGIIAAKGDWIAFLDSDDVWTPDAIDQRLTVLHEHPDATFIGCDFGYLSEQGKIDDSGFCRTRTIPQQTLSAAFEHNQPIRLERPLEAFLRAAPTYTGAVMVRRDALLASGGFDPDLRRAEDIDLWLRLAADNSFDFVPYLGTLYRQHAESLTHTEEPPAAWEVRAYQKLIKRPAFRPWRKLMRYRLSEYCSQNYWHYRRQGSSLNALLSAIAAAYYLPSNPIKWKLMLGSLRKTQCGGPESRAPQ